MQGSAADEQGDLRRPSSLTNSSQRGAIAEPTKASRWKHLWPILGGGVYLYFSLFDSRASPFLLSGDQVFYWMDSVRMMAGEHIYRDFFKFTPPGTDMLYLAAFRIFGLHLWVSNLMVLLLGILLCWLCFWIADKFLPQAESLLAAAIFVVFIFGKLLNATHHWFSEMAVLSAVAVLMERRNTTRVALASCLLGVATFFTQTRGPVAAAALAAYLLLDRSPWRLRCERVAWMLSGLVIMWLSLSAYFIATIGWRQLWYWQVTYSLHFKVAGLHRLGLSPSPPGRWLSTDGPPLMVYLLLPVVYLVSLLSWWKERGVALTPCTEGRFILTLAGLATLLEVAQSPNWLRVYCVAAPGILLLVWASLPDGPGTTIGPRRAVGRNLFPGTAPDIVPSPSADGDSRIACRSSRNEQGHGRETGMDRPTHQARRFLFPAAVAGRISAAAIAKSCLHGGLCGDR